MVGNNDNETYGIADWFPPWYDDGESMLRYIAGVKDVAMSDEDGDHDIVWQIGIIIMMRQLEHDIEAAKSINRVQFDDELES